MDLPTASFKLLDSLQQCTLIDTEQISYVMDHLRMAYVVGFEEGKANKSSTKEVMQLSKTGDLIHSYASFAEAAKAIKVTRQCLARHVHMHTLCKGFIWELVKK